MVTLLFESRPVESVVHYISFAKTVQVCAAEDKAHDSSEWFGCYSWSLRMAPFPSVFFSAGPYVFVLTRSLDRD